MFSFERTERRGNSKFFFPVEYTCSNSETKSINETDGLPQTQAATHFFSWSQQRAQIWRGKNDWLLIVPSWFPDCVQSSLCYAEHNRISTSGALFVWFVCFVCFPSFQSQRRSLRLSARVFWIKVVCTEWWNPSPNLEWPRSISSKHAAW